MSHSTGKIEVVRKTDDKIFLRYHRAADPADKAKFMIAKNNPDACWLDDYEEIINEYVINNTQNY